MFAATCSTELAGDGNARNDRTARSVEVFAFTGIAEQDNLPRVFALDKTSPNPFGRSTTIRYATPRLTRVALSVHSATHKLVVQR